VESVVLFRSGTNAAVPHAENHSIRSFADFVKTSAGHTCCLRSTLIHAEGILAKETIAGVGGRP